MSGPIPPVVKTKSNFCLNKFTFSEIIFSISGIVTISLHIIPILFSSLHIKCELVSKVFLTKFHFYNYDAKSFSV